MANILQAYDPNVLFKGGHINPFSKFMAGRQEGLARRDARERRARRQELEGRENMLFQQAQDEREGLAGLNEWYGPDEIGGQEYFQAAIQESPTLQKQMLQEMIKNKMGAQTRYKPDNEWVDDPNDPNYQIYMQASTNPQTGETISNPIPGMRKKKPLIERIGWEREKLNADKTQFEKTLKLNNKKYMLETRKTAIAELNSNLNRDIKKKNQMVKDGDLVVDYEAAKNTSMDAIDAIDRMIGNEKKGIKRHPGFKSAVGFKGGAGAYLFGLKDEPIEGTKAADFMTVYDRVAGQTFLEAFSGLRGGGQITEIEGKKAQDALQEMKTASSEGAFIEAAKRFQYNLKRGLELKAKELKLKTGGQTPIKQPTQTIVPTDADIDNMTAEELKAFLERQ